MQYKNMVLNQETRENDGKFSVKQNDTKPNFKYIFYFGFSTSINKNPSGDTTATEKELVQK